MDGPMGDIAGLTRGHWTHRRLDRPDGAFLRLSLWHPAGPVPAPNAPTILVLPGRAEYVEKYGEVAADLAARGMNVLSLDWRGQGGSSRGLPDPLIGHVGSFTEFLDDLAAAIEAFAPDVTGPFLALGHSMGGHILLRFVAERPHPFKAVIASAPMLGIRSFPLPEPQARQVARMAVRMGRAHHYALGQGAWMPAPPPPFAGNPLTSDPVRFARGHELLVEDPGLAVGGASWGWLDAAFTSMRHFFDQNRLEDVDLPILILSGRADRIVRPDRHDLAARRLANCTLIPFPGGRHELLMEADAIRDQVLAAIDTFLATKLGMDRFSVKP